MKTSNKTKPLLFSIFEKKISSKQVHYIYNFITHDVFVPRDIDHLILLSVLVYVVFRRKGNIFKFVICKIIRNKLNVL